MKIERVTNKPRVTIEQFAEEDNPSDHPSVGDMSGSDSHTITVFTLNTVDGSELEIVWLGESNGYYDESVSVSIQKDTP